MNFSDLQQGRFQKSAEKSAEKLAEVSTGNSTSAEQPRIPNTPPYQDGSECNPQLAEPLAIYKHAQAYAQAFQVQVAFNLQTALERRAKGEFCMTIRELDIAARLKLPLNKDFFTKALCVLGNMLCEGIPGEPDNPYQLRFHYNRGVQFKTAKFGQSEYERSSHVKRQKADERIAELLGKLNQHNLPAWSEEIEQGFPQELCKPEYMDWPQYEAAARAMQTRYLTGDQGHVQDSSPITGTVVEPFFAGPEGVTAGENESSQPSAAAGV